MAKWDKPIGIPFAENGDRTNIPDTSEDGNVNNTTGFGNKYEIDPAVGGLWLYRQTMNSLFYNMFSSIKEIQTKVPISVNGTTPDASGNIPIIIPEADGAGIKVIDDNSPDITSFNQITKDGVYYIYKQLSDGPQPYYEDMPCHYINLIVINVKVTGMNFDVCMQLTSFGLYQMDMRPGNIGSMPMMRAYNKDVLQWSPWMSRFGIPFVKNNIIIDDLVDNESVEGFPIIAMDDALPPGYNRCMYSASESQMLAQLGVSSDTWSTYTVPKYITNDYTNEYHNSSYCLFTRKINNKGYDMIKIKCTLSCTTKKDSAWTFLKVPLPYGFTIYDDNIDLKNNVRSYIKCSCERASIDAFDPDRDFILISSNLINIESFGGYRRVTIAISSSPNFIANRPYKFLVEIEAFDAGR